MRRYRCPDCRTVITMRPKGYLPRFQACLATLRKSLIDKHYRHRWLAGISQSRQRYWLNAFNRRVVAILGNRSLFPLKEIFEALVREGFSPVSRSL